MKIYKKNHKSKVTAESTFNGLDINTNPNNNQACYTKVLDKLDAHLTNMTESHSKVLQTRFDLRYPADGSVTPNSDHLSDFNYNLQRKLSREKYEGGHKVDPRLITVTEQSSSEHQHIHGVLLVNGNARQHYYPLLEQVEKTWGTAIGSDAKGLVDHCDKHGKNGIMINRNSDDFEEQKNQCFHQASYLAKTRDKDNNPKGSWLVRSTRLPKEK